MSLISKSIDQSNLNTLLAQLTPNLKLSDLLITAGYSTHISYLQIKGSHETLDFSGCQFDHVNFSGQFQNAT
ncbi:MAG TPA: hypothetical protein PLD88_08815, partial [Candidatus Berkiella sp.]|nr:hypothetical protein [Candidatus Berkiella sp.]